MAWARWAVVHSRALRLWHRSQWERCFQLRWLALLLLLAAVVRLAIAFWLIDADAMWSIDGGTYLINRDAWFGIEHDVVMHSRPPLAPGIALYPFTLAFGDNGGLRVWSIVGSLFLVGASYYMVRAFFDPVKAVLFASIVSADFWLLENMGAGAIVLYALALLCVVLRGLLDWGYSTTSTARLVLMSLALGLIPYVNQTVAGMALITLPVLFFVLLYMRWRDKVELLPLPVAAAIAAAVILALPSMPWYLAVAPGGDSVRFGGRLLQLGPSFFFEWFVWLFWVMTLWVTWPLARREKWGAVFWTVLAIMVPLMLLYSSDEAIMNFVWRSRYVASVVGAALIVGLLSRIWPGWKAACVWLVASGSVSLFLMLAWGGGNANSFSVFLRDDMSATSWVDKQGDDLPIVVDGWGRARFVASLTGRKVYTLRLWQFPHGAYDDIPRAFREENGVAFCVMGWGGLLSGSRCESRQLPSRGYILLNSEYSGLESVADRYLDDWYAALEHTNALPYTELVWQRGDVYVWEFDTEATALHAPASTTTD